MRGEAAARHAYSAATLCVNWARFALLSPNKNKAVAAIFEIFKDRARHFRLREKGLVVVVAAYIVCFCLFVCGCYGRRGFVAAFVVVVVSLSCLVFFEHHFRSLPASLAPADSLFHLFSLPATVCFVVCKLTLVRVCLFNVCVCVSGCVFFAQLARFDLFVYCLFPECVTWVIFSINTTFSFSVCVCVICVSAYSIGPIPSLFSPPHSRRRNRTRPELKTEIV